MTKNVSYFKQTARRVKLEDRVTEPSKLDVKPSLPIYVKKDKLKNNISLHLHDFFEIEIITAGSGYSIKSGKRVKIEKNFIKLGNRFEPEEIETDGNLELIKIQFLPDLFQYEKFGMCQISKGDSSPIILNPFLSVHTDYRIGRKMPQSLFEKIILLTNELFSEFADQHIMWHPKCHTLLESLLIEIYRDYVNYLKENDLEDRLIPDETSLSMILNHLEHNFNNADFRISSVAQKLGISGSELTLYFKKRTGISLKSYVNNKRMELATMLLKETNLKINEIAIESGFNDLSAFRRAFQKYTGLTPTQIRD